jgi:NADH-quinone oxidoreductase subunit F
MEGNPHQLIEGIIIAGYAIQAVKGYIYVRGEYALSMYRLRKAVEHARERGFLGKDILGKGFDFDVEVRSGAGAYVCGEETALIESIEGMRGNPRVKPPFPGVRGLWQSPTVVNNVETLANVPAIVANGPEWYRSFGTKGSPGVKLYQICGHVNHPQIVEAPLGLPLRELIELYGGGMRDGIPFKMCQTGGASFGFFTAEHLDTPMGYTSMQKQGGALGSGTMLVMNEKTCVVDVVRNILHFFQHESCGFCTPCRRGTRVLYDTISRIALGEGQEKDLDLMIDLAQTMAATANCALAMSPIFFIKTTIERLKDEYMTHILDKKCPLDVCR